MKYPTLTGRECYFEVALHTLCIGKAHRYLISGYVYVVIVSNLSFS